MPKRPPKKWMRRCKKAVKRKSPRVDDPGAVCAATFQRMGPEAHREAMRSEEPAPNPISLGDADDDFKPAIVAYLQRHDLGKYVQARPHEDGSWHVYYRDNSGRLQRVTVSDDEVRKHMGAREDGCHCAHKHPPSVPSFPCPVHGEHAAEERGQVAPVAYEPETREIDGETMRDAAVRHTERYWKARAEAALSMSLRQIGLMAKAEKRGDFERAAKYKALAAGNDELANLYMRQAATAAMAKEHGAREMRSENPRQPTTSVRVPLNVDTRGAHVDGVMKLGGGGGSTAPAMYESAEGRRKRRPKAGEGDGAKTVSRWVHWRMIDGGRTYVGKGQITGRAYYVTLSHRPGKPNWLLFRGTGTGIAYGEVEGAMFAADDEERRAAGIPASAEPTWKSTPREIERLMVAIVAELDPAIGAAFIPNVMRRMMREYKYSPTEIRRMMREASERGLVELRLEGGLGRLTPEERGLTVPGPQDTILSWVRPMHAMASREAREDSTPITTLRRDLKTYRECTRDSDVVDSPQAVWKLLGKQLAEEVQEVFVVVPLNIHDKLSDCPIEIARGERSRVSVDPAIVLQAAIAASADSFLVLHNHPGDRPDPSDADIDLTNAIAKAAEAVDTLEFDGHYIVSAKGVYDIGARKMWKL